MVIILLVVRLNAVLGVVQESKAGGGNSGAARHDGRHQPGAADGQVTVLHSQELVPGDVVLLEAGDAVPADGRCWSARH